jgi:hypothetical protein
LFLDIDGPICTERAYYAFNQDKNRHVLRAWDPIAVKLISRIAEDYQLKTVISSTWRIMHDVPTILLSHGYNGDFHKNDKTDRLKLGNPNRRDEIVDWLNTNQETDIFLVIDDIESGDSLVNSILHNNSIYCDVFNGFSYKDYKKAKQILNTQINLLK